MRVRRAARQRDEAWEGAVEGGRVGSAAITGGQIYCVQRSRRLQARVRPGGRIRTPACRVIATTTDSYDTFVRYYAQVWNWPLLPEGFVAPDARTFSTEGG